MNSIYYLGPNQSSPWPQQDEGAAAGLSRSPSPYSEYPTAPSPDPTLHGSTVRNPSIQNSSLGPDQDLKYESTSSCTEYVPYGPGGPGADLPSPEILPAGYDPHRGPYQKSNPWLWSLEVLSLLLGVLTLTVIVVVLVRAEGTRPPEWPITINTLLAFLVALSRIAFMYPIIEGLAQLKWVWYTSPNPRPLIDFQTFDDASRGPLGCIKILMRLKGPVACLGALVSVTGLITSTLTQQAVDYEQLDAITTTANATLNRATIFSLYNKGNLELGPWEMVRAKQAMLDGGLYVPNGTFPHITPECPSGNCDWDTYGSIGICSDLVNLTAMGNETLLGELRRMTNTRATSFLNSTSMFLSDGLFFNAIPRPSVPAAFAVVVGNLDAPMGVFNESVYQAMAGEYFVAYTDSTVTASTVSNSSFTYLGVSFYWCTTSYKTSVRDGVATTDIVGRNTRVATKNPKTLNFSWSNDFTVCYVAGNCNETVGSMFVEFETPAEVENEITYGVNVWTGLLGSVLVGSTMYDSLLMDEMRGIVTSTGGGIAQAFASALYGDFLTPKSPPPAEQMLNVKGIVSNFARSLTNHIMDGDTRYAEGNRERATVYGTVYSPQTFIKIHWKWIGVLAAQIAATIIFLVSTVFVTHRSGTQVFKGSSIATMSALSDEARRHLGETGDVKRMNRRAQRINVRLERGSSGIGHWLAMVRPVSTWEAPPGAAPSRMETVYLNTGAKSTDDAS
ncbi:hypothetical protein GQ53DRAFT_749727 [Thozetella sp. PMI_491]|nr:hypothetical protein GQ53DRAFT_749727 [Thozetella sp. PMI_491]